MCKFGHKTYITLLKMNFSSFTRQRYIKFCLYFIKSRVQRYMLSDPLNSIFSFKYVMFLHRNVLHNDPLAYFNLGCWFRFYVHFYMFKYLEYLSIWFWRIVRRIIFKVSDYFLRWRVYFPSRATDWRSIWDNLCLQCK